MGSVLKVFSYLPNPRVWPKDNNESIQCIYVSDAAIYKNQWVVIRALKKKLFVPFRFDQTGSKINRLLS